MKRTLSPSLALPLCLLAACATTPNYEQRLEPGSDALLLVAPEDVPDFRPDWEERESLLPALDHSIDWLYRDHAKTFFPIAGVDHRRAIDSLERFRRILTGSANADAFQQAIEREFDVYRAAGWDGDGGGVLFTAYCTPTLEGSLTPDARYRFPLYALPDDLVKAADGSVLGWDTRLGRMPRYPSRGAIEAGGLLANRDLELVWLADPIDAYIAHVNGSAVVELPDGSELRLGYAGKNGRPYASLGQELIEDGKLSPGGASLAGIRRWAASVSAEERDAYLARNESYVFFTPIGGPPHGSLDVPVTTERSIATDKRLFPRASLVFVTPKEGQASVAPMDRFYMDQDTGGAIQSAGRADLYLGVGDLAEEVAGRTRVEGQMYYLFLRPPGRE